MEFEEFAEQFRQRAAAKMLEFEKALEQAHRDVVAKDAATPGGRHAPASPPPGADPMRPSSNTTARRPRGPVRGVLRTTASG